MTVGEMKRILAILDDNIDDRASFEMDHEILYIPWEEERGAVADALEAADCFWDEDAERWASY